MDIVEEFDSEDRAVRERQVRKARRLKLYWDNIFQAWYSEVAHDWRIYDQQQASDSSTSQSYYDKPVNTFRAYIESVIAALSITTPAPKCFPEDADSTLDIVTARAGDKIGQLIGRHNNTSLLWLHALYIYYTEGTVYGFSYPDAKEEYGVIEEDVTKEELETKDVEVCPACGQVTEIDKNQDAFQPEEQPQDNCEFCGNMVQMVPDKQPLVTTKIVGKTSTPRSRVNLEAYGGLYVKIANYAKKPSDTPYLIFSEETHYANAIEKYDHLRDSELTNKIKGESGSGGYDEYSRLGRLNTIYQGEYPNYVVTMRSCWLRPASYNILKEEEDIKELRKLYPRGVKVCMVNDEFGEAKHESLDDYWTITFNPMEDYLVHDAAGTNLVPTQEITNDLISLVLQTIEHGIGQTFADPGVLNFPAYRDTEVTPGGVYEASPKSGKALNESFFEMKTATLSHEVMPFFEVVQTLAQLVSGALPSLFGGQLDGSNTASEYSMSRAQALQRIQNTWKLFTAWWKEIQGKAIPLYINNMKADEKDVVQNDDGSFVNVFIRRAELEGRIGKIELEASENLPQTWVQVRDSIMKMMEMQNPQILAMLGSPENLPLLRDALGLVDFYIPGEDDRNKQYDEIKECLASEPIPGGMDQMGQPMEESSVPVDPIYDNHQIEFEIVRKWAVSEAGRLAKIENDAGYQNVLLHGIAHYEQLQQQMMMQAQQGAEVAEAGQPQKPEGSSKVEGEADVSVGA
ncbi:MAG: hypothetical protein ABWY25_01425 [Paenisporosarcina sp.]